MTVFRLGLIGAGRMGRTHLRAIAASQSVRVVAVAEPAAAIRAELDGPGLIAHATVAAMLAAGGLDGVLIAAPTDQHFPQVAEAAAAGLPILCEKPCGTTAASAAAAAEVCAAHGVLLQIAYWRRFVPALQSLRARIAAGELGALYSVICHQWDGAPPAAHFRAHSGGIFVDMGVHEFDQIRWLTSQDITATRAATARAGANPSRPGDVEHASVLCSLSGGATAIVSLGCRFPLGDVCRVEVFGTDNAEDIRFLWPPDGDAVFLDALRSQAEGFAAAVGGRTTGAATAADAVAALQAAEAALAALAPSPA